MINRSIHLIGILLLGLVLMLFLGYVDFITGVDLNFFVFYFIPVSFIAWYARRPYAIGMSLLAAMVWLIVDSFSGHQYKQLHFAYWNAFVRWTSFVILALAISQVKTMLEKEKSLKEELARALDKIREMIEVAKKIAEGNLLIEPPILQSGEAGDLDDTLNFMLNKLAEQKNLEKRINLLEKQAIMAETASFLAHEIRNPLNLIMLTAHHLGSQFAPQEQAAKTKFDDLILSLKSEVDQLNKVVSDFMAIGRSTKLLKTKFKIAEIFDQVQVLIKQQLISKKINLRSSGEMNYILLADQEQMRLVLLNILVNAIAAVPIDGTIELHAEIIGHPAKIAIIITDSGAGINGEDMNKIFEPYFTRKPGGTGLGLPLAKRIIEEHNGTIKADNCPGKGARFTITLPVEEV